MLSNIGFFKGDFLGQNVRIMEDALFGDDYIKMTEKYDGRGLFDEDTGHPFKPYVIRKVGEARIAVIGQAFPRTSNANPQKYFFPDWSFNLREDEMQSLVEEIRENEKPDAVIVVSHNGMDVDLKMASRVVGIDAIFGGHTHDGMAKAVEISNPGGKTLVTNAGCSGKYVGVMDFDIKGGKVVDYRYKMLPILSNMIPADKETQAYIDKMRQTQYDDKIVESRAKDRYFNPDRVGKTYADILNEKLCTTEQTLYRRGNFMGTWDQVLVNALREEYSADFAFSAGVRWGTSVLAGDAITMEDLMTQTAMTYGETYVSDMTGAAIKDVMEGIAENLFQKDPYLQSGGDMVRIGGLDYSIDPNGEFGSRISDIRDDEGTPLDPKKTYQVAGWAQVDTIGSGRLMWDVAADYLRNQDELSLSKVNHPKVIGVKDNPGIADYYGELGDHRGTQHLDDLLGVVCGFAQTLCRVTLATYPVLCLEGVRGGGAVLPVCRSPVGNGGGCRRDSGPGRAAGVARTHRGHRYLERLSGCSGNARSVVAGLPGAIDEILRLRIEYVLGAVARACAECHIARLPSLVGSRSALSQGGSRRFG